MSQRLGDLLVREHQITPEQLTHALALQRESHLSFLPALERSGGPDGETVAGFFCRQYGIAAINLPSLEMDASVFALVPAEIARRHQLVPLSKVGTSLTVAMADPTDVSAMDEIKFRTGLNVEPVVATHSHIAAGLGRAYGEQEQPSVEQGLEQVIASMAQAGDLDVEVEDELPDLSVSTLDKVSEEAPIVKLVNVILNDAIRRGASDIHIEPYEKEYRVRFRVDGMMQTVMSPPLRLRDAIASRIKIMAKLDISEKRLPQDGRVMLKMNLGGRKKQLDFRISTLPTLFGEKIVLRLLDKEALKLDMTQLGFDPEPLQKFERAILRPYGMVLVTGPTGSGKTNTLYSAISRLNAPDVNIMTAEDPVEFQLAGVNQVQMKEQIGLNFATALRAFLRQDPNIILVGEIRDLETAETAIKAALTGHLVLSTVHTNGAAETITRLLNMGIDPFLVATSVHLICAQRLVRRVCSQCAAPVKVPAAALIAEGMTPEEAASARLRKGAGCAACNDTGYKGRTGLYEVLEIDDGIREMIFAGASAPELRRKAVSQGMITLRRAGLLKAMQGIISLEEVVRETALV